MLLALLLSGSYVGQVNMPDAATSASHLIVEFDPTHAVKLTFNDESLLHF